MKDYLATIVSNEKIAENIYAVTFELGEIPTVRAGQFGDILVGGTHLLRRPIAICKIEGDTVTFCYQIKGEGTQKLKTLGAGTRLNVLMPLGNGFFVEENEKKRRMGIMLPLSEEKLKSFYQSQIGTTRKVLWESTNKSGKMCGFTENYVKVQCPFNAEKINQIEEITLNENMFDYEV